MMRPNLTPYRKILFYIAGALLVMLNDLFGFGIDEDVYKDHAKNIVEVILLLITGVGVYQFRNAPLPPRPS